jgi:tetratricopeptide (TPR) repeat protein
MNLWLTRRAGATRSPGNRALPCALLGATLAALAIAGAPMRVYAQSADGDDLSAARARAAASPEDAGVQCALAETALDAGDLDLAVEAAERCTELDDHVARHLLVLARAHLEKAQAAGGLGALSGAWKGKAAAERAVKIDPAYLPARVLLLNYHLQAPTIAGGSRREAKRQSRELARRDPALGVWARLRVLDDDAGDPDLQAIYAAAAPLIGTPADSGRTAVSTAIAVANRVRSDALRERLISELHAAHPEDPSVRYARARLWILQNRELDRAEAVLTQYISLRDLPPGAPGPAAARWRLGQLYEKRGDVQRAREQYREAVELRPDFAEARADLKRLTKS